MCTCCNICNTIWAASISCYAIWVKQCTCHIPAAYGTGVWLVFTGLPCLVYLHNNIVFSITVAEHLSQLRDVFTRLKNAGLKLNHPNVTCFRTGFAICGIQCWESGLKQILKKLDVCCLIGLFLLIKKV